MPQRGGLPANFNGYHRADVAENARIWMREHCSRIANQQGKNAIELEQRILDLLESPAYGYQLRDRISSVIGYSEESVTIKLITHYREIIRLQGTEQPGDWYKHEQLPAGDWIRTLRVLPMTDSIIRCEMRSVERDKAKFRCLSYEWVRNYKSETHVIELNGLSYRVRENLYDFLSLAQTDYANEEFWIDAMCIDQTNIQERNDQVNKMGETYSGKHVLAWLGKRKPEDRSLDSNVYTELEVFKERSEDIYNWIKEAYRVIREFWGWPGYWLRAWIVQEQQLASEVCIQLDDEQHTVAELEQLREKAYDLLEDFHPRITPGSDIFINTRSHFGQLEITSFLKRAQGVDPASATDMSSDDRDPPFAHVLKNHRHTYCENWHDKIYALRALCSEGLSIDVDYSEDLRSLLIQVLSAPRRAFCLCFIRNLVKMYSLWPHSPELADMYVQTEFTFEGTEKTHVKDLLNSSRSGCDKTYMISLDTVCSNLTGELSIENDPEGHLIARMPWSETALEATLSSPSDATDKLTLAVKLPVGALCLQYLTVFATRYEEVACDVQNTIFTNPNTNLAAQ